MMPVTHAIKFRKMLHLLSTARLLQEAAGDGRAMRMLSRAGNTLLLAGLGGTAYFGYYTLRYKTEDMQNLIDQRKKTENEFPGSSVSLHI